MNDLQRTDEWFQARCGKLTASCMADAMSFLKSGGSSKARENLIAMKAVERLTGMPQGTDISRVPGVKWGIENEPRAKLAVSIEYGIIGKDVSVIDHPSIDMLAASPDWLVDGIPWEFKCPNTMTHFNYMLSGVAPEEYRPQMALQMLCCGSKKAQFVSFDPRLTPEYQLFIVGFSPDQSYLDEVEKHAIQFLGEVDEMVRKLKALRS